MDEGVVDQRRDQVRRAVREQQRIAVGRGLHHGVDADRGAAAGPVLDHHRLAELRGQEGGEQPRHRVVRRARRVGQDQPHRPGRIGLGVRRAGREAGRHNTGQRNGGQQGAAGDHRFHPSAGFLRRT